MRTASTLIALLLAVTLLAACGGGGGAPTPTAPAGPAPEATPGEAIPPAGGAGAVTGDPENGRQLFLAQGCGGCHVIEGVEGAVGEIGPDLTTIATVAQERVDDPNYTGTAETAAQYIRESIVDPNTFVVQGFQPNVMPQTFDETLADEQIDDLVAFLMQQE